VDGFIIVDKPSGVTSFSIVAMVRRLTGVRRVGHAGTLDPMASGVLPVAIGQATRFIEYLDDELKTYAGGISFGTTTETYDAEGAVTATADASHVTARAVEAALARFVGDIAQAPPAFSALKVAGKPRYAYAREGKAVATAPRLVHIEGARLLAFAGGVAEVEVRCGKGTYIRSIAHDLGQVLGCGAHLSALKRTSTGGFALRDARSPEQLVALASAARIGDAILALDRAVERRPAAIVGEEHATDLRCGRDVCFEAESRARSARDAGICRAYALSGEFLGVLQLRPDGSWHPQKLLANG
jgi:tRNA pseudouridine55 synthase